MRWFLLAISIVAMREYHVSHYCTLTHLFNCAWVPLVIIITGTGERVAESYNGDPNGAPLLHVEYF
jgi:hypothetical protein